MLSIVDKIDLPSGRSDVQIIMAGTEKKENIKNLKNYFRANRADDLSNKGRNTPNKIQSFKWGFARLGSECYVQTPAQATAIPNKQTNLNNR